MKYIIPLLALALIGCQTPGRDHAAWEDEPDQCAYDLERGAVMWLFMPYEDLQKEWQRRGHWGKIKAFYSKLNGSGGYPDSHFIYTVPPTDPRFSISTLCHEVRHLKENGGAR